MGLFSGLLAAEQFADACEEGDGCRSDEFPACGQEAGNRAPKAFLGGHCGSAAERTPEPGWWKKFQPTPQP